MVAFIVVTENLGARMYPAGGAPWRRLVIPVAGALISKHHAAGAVVGGVVGGAGGYLLGRHKDRKYPNNRRIYKTKRIY